MTAQAAKRSKKAISQDPTLQYLKRPTFWRIMNKRTGEFVSRAGFYASYSKSGKIISNEAALTTMISILKKSRDINDLVVVPYEVQPGSILPVVGYGE